MNVDHFPTLRACVDTTSIRLFATSALLATCFAFAINPCSVEVSAGETLRLIADKDVDPFSEQYSNEYVKLLSNQDVREELSQPRSLPEPTQPTENIDALAPAPQSSSKSSSRLFKPLTPAPKMTIRRDPQSTRFIGTEKEKGPSLLAVQEELQRSDQRNTSVNNQIAYTADAGWSSNEPYGKYIYIHHAPLLFEDIPVERYGEECHPCMTPVLSLTKFMATVPFLPYKITTDYWAAQHNDAYYAYDYQGNLRPGILEGSIFPSYQAMKQYPVANLAGAAAEVGTVAGIVLFIP